MKRLRSHICVQHCILTLVSSAEHLSSVHLVSQSHLCITYVHAILQFVSLTCVSSGRAKCTSIVKDRYDSSVLQDTRDGTMVIAVVEAGMFPNDGSAEANSFDVVRALWL